jgi:hypothetical protein
MPRFGGSAASTPDDRRWSLAVSNTHGELLFVIFELGCGIWLAWEAFF